MVPSPPPLCRRRNLLVLAIKKLKERRRLSVRVDRFFFSLATEGLCSDASCRIDGQNEFFFFLPQPSP